MVRYVHSNSGGYSWLKDRISDLYDWVDDRKQNLDYWETQIPYYREVKYALENEQYWKDYKKNTGFTPRYPYRSYGSSGVSAIKTVYRGFNNVKRLYG